MTKILILSDTHGNVRDAISIIRSHDDLNMFFHLGDHFEDALMIHEHTGLDYKAVTGNMDMPQLGSRLMIFEIELVRIMLVHGDKFRVNSGILLLEEEAEKKSVDIICFGHTHRSFEEWRDGRLFVNPGSLLGSRKTYGILHINGIKIEYSLRMFFNKGG